MPGRARTGLDAARLLFVHYDSDYESGVAPAAPARVPLTHGDRPVARGPSVIAAWVPRPGKKFLESRKKYFARIFFL